MRDDRLLRLLALDVGPTAAVLEILDRDGEEARVVGGAVRNALLGVPAGDVDIATTAVPDGPDVPPAAVPVDATPAFTG